MLQKLLAVAIAALGVWLFVKGHWLIGPLLSLAGAGIFKGAQHDQWFSFDLSDRDGGDWGGGDGGD